MEMDGHPTHDLLSELKRRGARAYPGTAAGPDPAYTRLAERQALDEMGLWVYLPPRTYDTGFDDPLDDPLVEALAEPEPEIDRPHD